jgi:hypothetical protein
VRPDTCHSSEPPDCRPPYPFANSSAI